MSQLHLELESLVNQTDRNRNSPSKGRNVSAGRSQRLYVCFVIGTIILVCMALVQFSHQHPMKEESLQMPTPSPSWSHVENLAQAGSAPPTTAPSSSYLRYDHLSNLALQQIENYRNGSGIILNMHMTHHAGTTVCRIMGHAPNSKGSPSFACWKVSDNDNVTDAYPKNNPWRHDETATNVEIVRQYFHFISWEYSNAPAVALVETDWENPNIVSLYVTRDPMDRLLAGDGYTAREYPDINNFHNATLEEWWMYAKGEKKASARNVDNYPLRILAGNGCCNGSYTDPKHLETAKQLLSRFTFIIDMDCLNDSLAAMAELLGIELPPNVKKGGRTHEPASERIPYREVYDFLLEKNRLSIELHEFVKSRSLIDCSRLPP